MLEWDEVVDLAKCHEKVDQQKKESESYLVRHQKKFRWFHGGCDDFSALLFPSYRCGRQ